MRSRELLWLLITLFVWSADAQYWDWVQRCQGPGSSGNSVAFDAQGNAYVAGGFTGTNQLGTNQFISMGGSDVFIAKLNSFGQIMWAISAGGPGDDWLRLVSTTNGTVFVCGHFAIDPLLLANTVTNRSDATNVFVARVDVGKFSWFHSSSPGVDSGYGGIALGPDGTIWTIGVSNKVFVRSYDPAGQLLNSFAVGESTFFPRGIGVSEEQIFISGFFCTSVDLGTTNLTDVGCAYFTAALETTGIVRWAWNAGRYSAANPITGIAPAADGGVISIGSWNTGLPQGYGFVVRHSADGVLLWRVDRTGHFKSVYQAFGVAVDAAGYVHVTGQALGAFHDGYFRSPAWLLVLDPNGQQLSEEFIVSGTASDRNFASVIAVNDDGDTVIAGQLMGTPLFGTNMIGLGASEAANAFVARRPTVRPALRVHGGGTNVVLNWPRTALPFALQQSDVLRSNAWSDIANPPEIIGSHHETKLPVVQTQQFFRLRMTNEAWACHVPVTYPVVISPSPAFLGRSPVFITSSNSWPAPAFTGWGFDAYYAALSFRWRDGDTGQELTNGTSVAAPAPRRDWGGTYLVASLNDATLRFSTGTNTILFVASDGECHATNSATVYVLSIPIAIDEIITAVQAATTGAETDRLVAPLRAARNAAEIHDFTTSAEQMRDFQSRLLTSAELMDTQKTLFHAAENSVLAILQGGP